MELTFYKYQGTGNDFVIIDDRDSKFPDDQALIRSICNRHFGVGADGLILVRNSSEADFHMLYFNSDGRLSSMCGNGGRCLAQFVVKSLGFGAEEGSFMAFDGIHRFRIMANAQVKLEMGNVKEVSPAQKDYFLDTGSPHYVAFHKHVEDADLITMAHKVRYSEPYEQAGVNVNLVEIRKDGLFMRTYERGVEDETLSCGTGMVAAALAWAFRDPRITSPVNISAPGGKTKVHFEKNNSAYENIWLEGPAIESFKGQLEI